MTTENIPEGCLPFDAEKAMNGWPCVNDSGEAAQFVFKDKKEYVANPYLFVIHYEDCSGSVWVNSKGLGFAHKIYLKKKTKTYYANLYFDKDYKTFDIGKIHETKQDCENYRSKLKCFVQMIQFEVEE